MNEVGKIEGSEVVKKKRGRKRIKEKMSVEDQRKFYVDYTKDQNNHELVVKLIKEANNKSLGREVVFKDLVDIALSKLTQKDIGRIKESSMDKMDKVKLQLQNYNEKNGTNISLGEYLIDVKKLS